MAIKPDEVIHGTNVDLISPKEKSYSNIGSYNSPIETTAEVVETKILHHLRAGPNPAGALVAVSAKDAQEQAELLRAAGISGDIVDGMYNNQRRIN